MPSTCIQGATYPANRVPCPLPARKPVRGPRTRVSKPAHGPDRRGDRADPVRPSVPPRRDLPQLMAEIEHDPDLTAPAEAIHMPEPSYLPATLALGVTITLVGIITWLPVMIIGLIIVVVVLVRWIRSAREELNDLPLEH